MERKRTISWEDPRNSSRDVASISGLDYLNAIKEGKIGPPPAAVLIGYRLSEVDNGHAVFELDPQEYHYNPFATVHGGIVTTLLDTAMTAAILSTLPKGMGCATVEIKVNFIRPITAETHALRCEAGPVHIGNRLAVADARLKDNNGELFAYGVSTCSIFRVGGTGSPNSRKG